MSEREAYGGQVVGVQVDGDGGIITIRVNEKALRELRHRLGVHTVVVVEHRDLKLRIGDMVDYHPVLGHSSSYRHQIAGGPYLLGGERCWKLVNFTGLVAEANLERPRVHAE